MGEGDPGIGRRGDSRCDTWYDFKGNAFIDQDFDLLAATAEDEGITAFQAGNHMALGCFVRQQSIDAALGEGVVAPFFAYINAFCRLLCEFHACQGVRITPN